jgi:hypothetical protein
VILGIAANDRCRMDGRKTLTAEDLLGALQTLGFDQYNALLTDYLARYREVRRPACARTPCEYTRGQNVALLIRRAAGS